MFEHLKPKQKTIFRVRYKLKYCVFSKDIFSPETNFYSGKKINRLDHGSLQVCLSEHNNLDELFILFTSLYRGCPLFCCLFQRKCHASTARNIYLHGFHKS